MKQFSLPNLLRTGILLFLAASSLTAQERPGNPDSLLSVVVRMSRQGEIKGAVRLAQTIIAFYPNYHDARIMVARSMAWEGQHEKALRHLDTVLADNPRHRDARFLKASILSWQKKYTESITLLQQLVAEEGETAELAAALGRVYLWSGDHRTAHHWYEVAFERDSLSEEVNRGLARTAFMLGDEQASLRFYRRLLLLVPHDGEAHAWVQRLEYRARHELSLQASLESFTKSTFQNHTLLGIEYYNGMVREVKPYIHLSRLSKFGSRAERLGAGFYWSPGYSTGIMGQILTSPGSGIVARWDAVAEVNYVLAAGFELVGAYRFLAFVQNDVHILSPGLTWYRSENLWVTFLVYTSRGTAGTSSNTGMATVIYKPDNLTTIRFTISKGSEVQESGLTQGEITQRPTSVTLNVRRRLAPMLALGVSYQFSSRLPSDSHTVFMTTSFFF